MSIHMRLRNMAMTCSCLGLLFHCATGSAGELPQALFEATPGALRLETGPQSLLRRPEHICSVFAIRAVHTPFAGGVLTSTGLGQSTFAVVSGNKAQDCSAPYTRETFALDLPIIGQNGIQIRLRVPRRAFPEPGQHVDGRLRLTALPKFLTDVPLKLDGGQPSSWVRIASWAFGVLLPTVITGYIGYLLFIFQKKWESDSAEEDRFEEWVGDHWNELTTFFRTHLPNLMRENPDYLDWAASVETDLIAQCGLNQAPRRTRARVRHALASGPRGRALKAISRLYPDWKKVIQGISE